MSNSKFINSSSKIIFFLSIIFISGCEDVIEIDLKDVEPRIVIEGIVIDRFEPYTVKISKTGDYFNPSVFPMVSGAFVEISDDDGNSDTLRESEAGIYQSDSLQGVPGRTYTLKVIVDGKEYMGGSTMPLAIDIDSLSYVYQPGGSFGPDKKEGYILYCHITDHAGIEDYCRFKVFKNGELVKGFYVYNDKHTDGRSMDYHKFDDDEPFALNDTIRVELLTLDKANYYYFKTIRKVATSGDRGNPVMTETPANPNTNLSNGALGYFGAYTVRMDSLIIQ